MVEVERKQELIVAVTVFKMKATSVRHGVDFSTDWLPLSVPWSVSDLCHSPTPSTSPLLDGKSFTGHHRAGICGT